MAERPPRPNVENAPGLAWRPCKVGWEARWRPRADLVARGYSPTPTRLWAGVDPAPAERGWISDRCNTLQSEMLVWGRGGLPKALGTFDGTLKSLAACYQVDPDSRYHKARYRTRQNYDSMIKRIVRDHGDELVADIKGRIINRWYESWVPSGMVMAHGLIGMLRTIFGFGATIIDDGACNDECERLCAVLHKMRFETPHPRNERLTAEQATAVRIEARRKGRLSLALAQAFQFECTFRQKDVIGEMVPQSEPGVSDVTHGNEKWMRGIRWSQIDANLILRHKTSKKLKDVEIDLKLAPMILEELTLNYPGCVVEDATTKNLMVHREILPVSGPVIVSETRGRPYIDHEFRRDWRLIARKAGVPNNVFNMDTRAGAITEGILSGASIESVRKAATHTNVGMTQRYSRGDIEEVADVMRQRAANRNKKGTSGA